MVIKKRMVEVLSEAVCGMRETEYLLSGDPVSLLKWVLNDKNHLLYYLRKDTGASLQSRVSRESLLARRLALFSLECAREAQSEYDWEDWALNLTEKRFKASYTPVEAAMYWCGYYSPGGRVDRLVLSPYQMGLRSEFLREVFGNPFRRVSGHYDGATFYLSGGKAPLEFWGTGESLRQVVLMAGDIFDRDAFRESGILADALEDAGMEGGDILSHLRDPATSHMRGCWAYETIFEAMKTDPPEEKLLSE